MRTKLAAAFALLLLTSACSGGADSTTGPEGSTTANRDVELTDGRGNVLIGESSRAGVWYCEAGGSIESVTGEYESVVTETTPRELIVRALRTFDSLAGQAEEVIGPVKVPDHLADVPGILDLNRAGAAAAAINPDGLVITVLLLDPARPQNKPAGELKVRFSTQYGWQLGSVQMCSSAATGEIDQ